MNLKEHILHGIDISGMEFIDPEDEDYVGIHIVNICCGRIEYYSIATLCINPIICGCSTSINNISNLIQMYGDLKPKDDFVFTSHSYGLTIEQKQ